MTAAEKTAPTTLAEAWGSRLPPGFSREDRLLMIAEAAKLLMEDTSPASKFLGGAILAWLSEGGDLVRDYLRIGGRAGSHRTPSAVWRELQESSSGGATDRAEAANLESMNILEENE